MSERLSYASALERAIALEMRRDPTVFHMGTLQPASLLAEFGPNRVRRTPISEGAMTGAAIGAAGCGLRPIVNWRCVTFSFVGFDQIVNQAAKIRYMSGGQRSFPIVFRSFYIGGMRTAAQHSQTGYSMFAHAAGLKIAVPATPADAMGLLRTAVRDDDPVVIFEATRLDGVEGDVPDDYLIPLGQADVKRVGTDVTVVAIGYMVGLALAAAEELADDGISVEVVDPRTLVPLDVDAIRSSVRRTGRLVVADESAITCSMAAEVAALACEDPDTFRALRAPVRRVCARQVPVPYSPPLEDFVLPDRNDIVAGVRAVLAA